MKNGSSHLKISFNSPVILVFTILCFAALLLGQATDGKTTDLFFSVYRSSLGSPLTYVRFAGHVLGHAGWEHFIGNIMLILIVGPLLEEKYGSLNMLFVILAVALVTGVINFAFFRTDPFVILYQHQRRSDSSYLYTGGSCLSGRAGLRRPVCA